MTKKITSNIDGSGELSMTRTVLILAAVIGGAIAALTVFLSWITPDMGGATVSGHGTVAMVLGIVFSLVVGIGLMGLVFYSNRRGYDEGLTRRDEGDRVSTARNER